LLANIERGTTNLVVGTHALVQEQVAFHKLGLVVIDEQHRFGVAQRAALRAKGLRPDVLLMTATPIPRTLALTDYSELDVSKIPDLPPGRKPVTTLVKPESRRDEIYDLIRAELEAGRQAYIIYPLVEESEKIDLKSATEMADHLQAEVFPAHRVALLHGRMKQDAKDHVMHAFAAGRIEGPGLDDCRRGRRRRAERVDHGRRACGAIRVVAAASVARPRRPRSGAVGVHPAVSGAVDRRCARALESDVVHHRRLRDCGTRSRAARPRRFLRHAAIGLPKLRTGDLVRDRDIMELAHHEARALVERGALTSELNAFVAQHWQEQFGLIEIG
jgi:ATP-dependent DNA helicase RecG